MKLIASVLGHEYPIAGKVNTKAFGVADPGGVTISGRELLVDLLGVVSPDAAAGLKFSARLGARRLEGSILELAGIGCGAHVHIHKSIAAYEEGMHGMVAAERQSGHHRSGRALRHNSAGGQRITNDAVVDLGVNRAVVQVDSGATGCARLGSLAE